jgi:type IV pilus assembly protein PilN
VKIRMSLLPYREARRKAVRQRFWAGFGVALGVAALAVGVGHMVIGLSISNQETRNNFIKSQSAVLDGKIKEIASLKENIDSLKAQQEIIGKLQSDRAAPTHLLDQMTQIVPSGMQLTGLVQKGSEIQVTGMAQSSDLVSGFMVSVQNSAHLMKPELIEIKAVQGKDNRRYQQFSLKFAIRSAQDEKPAVPPVTLPAAAPAPAASAPAASASAAAAPAAVASSAAPAMPAVSAPAVPVAPTSAPAVTPVAPVANKTN